MIEMPPTPGRNVVVERAMEATLGTSEGCVAPMCEPNVEVVFLGSERDAIHLPGRSQIQEFGEDIDVAHGTDHPLCLFVHRFLPTGKSEEPKNKGKIGSALNKGRPIYDQISVPRADPGH